MIVSKASRHAAVERAIDCALAAAESYLVARDATASYERFIPAFAREAAEVIAAIEEGNDETDPESWALMLGLLSVLAIEAADRAQRGH